MRTCSTPVVRRLDIGVLDTDVFQSYIDKQSTGAGTGLPALRKLDSALYSTKSYVKP